jgi:hypothetical protein
MIIRGPAQIFGESLIEGRRDLSRVNGDMMLKAVFADEVEQFLEIGNANYPVSTEGIEFIVGQLALADVGQDLPVQVIGGDAAVGERLGF